MSTEPSAQVWYVELRGEQAAEQLTQLLDKLPAELGFLGAELLISPAQPDLALVSSRWAGELPAVALPSGAKAWSFRVVASR